MEQNQPTIAIVEGGGTGLEVANIFKRTIKSLYNKNLDFLSFREKFNYSPNTFVSLRNNFYKQDKSKLKKIIKKETKDLIEFYSLARINSVGMFRTAINAETLYYVRKNVKKIKAVILPIRINGIIDKNIIFIRDQLQGYYVNEKIKDISNGISINSKFTENNFLLLTKFTKKFLYDNGIRKYSLLYIYKYHLFGLDLQKMIESAVKITKIKNNSNFDIFQPDTGMHKLLGELYKIHHKNVVIIVGNEIGDVLLETLIHYYNLANKETFFTLNMAFIDEKKPLEVLQTMHGSADDIAGKEILNPIATIRAAAYALEKWLEIPNARNKIEKAIKKAINNKILTKDMDGKFKTNKVVDYIISNF